MRSVPCLVALAALVSAFPPASASAAPDPVSSTPEQGDPEARRQALNSAEASMARRQLAQNSASQRQYEDAVSAARAQEELQADTYVDGLNRHDDAVRDYRAERKQWERKNPACWDGDAAKCPAEPRVAAPGG